MTYVPKLARSPTDCSVLYDDRRCLIRDFGQRREVLLGTRWSESIADLVRHYDVNSLEIEIHQGYTRTDLAFLDQAKRWKGLQITAPPTFPWNRISSLKSLEALVATCSFGKPESLGISKLTKLRECSIDWNQTWGAEVLGARHLLSLEIAWPILSPRPFDECPAFLDIRKLPKLVELHLVRLPRLTSIEICEPTKLRAIRISHCNKLKLNLARMVTRCEYLRLEGKGFAVETISRAKSLKELWLLGVGKLDSADFLDELPHLQKLVSFNNRVSPMAREQILRHRSKR